MLTHACNKACLQSKVNTGIVIGSPEDSSLHMCVPSWAPPTRCVNDDEQHLLGKQGLILSVSCRQLGGFKDIPIMEDYELVQRLRKHGRPAIIPQAITTSGRRWRSVGFLQTTLINQVRLGHILAKAIHVLRVVKMLHKRRCTNLQNFALTRLCTECLLCTIKSMSLTVFLLKHPFVASHG